MKKNIPCICLPLLMLAVTACQTIQPLTIDYMVPGKISFPPQLKRVGVVNNVSELSENREVIPAEEKAQAGKGEITAFSYPTVLSVVATEALAESVADANYFDEVVICDSALREKDIIPRESTLSREEVNTLAKELDVDFILALEDMNIKAVYSARYLPETGDMYGAIDSKVTPTIAIYLPNRNQPMGKFSLTDSIFWDAVGPSETYVRNNIISNSRMAEESSRFGGTIPANFLFPKWETANRYLYNNGSASMRDAAALVNKERWDDACKYWQSTLQSAKSKKLQMKANHNIALYYEMKDDLEQALEWELKSQKLAAEIEKIDTAANVHIPFETLAQANNYVSSLVYTRELEKRLNNFALLKTQMDRFKDNSN